MRNVSPTGIHQTLCGFIALCFFAALYPFVPFSVAAAFAMASCVGTAFFAVPLTARIYGIVSDEVREDAVVHTTDAGCAALIFLLIFFVFFSVVASSLKERREYSRVEKSVPVKTPR